MIGIFSQDDPFGLFGNRRSLGVSPPIKKKRRVFFSFDYDDVFRANIVRNSWVTKAPSEREFVDAADREKLQQRDPIVIKRWINDQLDGCSVTAVLIGKNTNGSKWVKYEIERSRELKKGILGIYIHKIPDARSPRSLIPTHLREGPALGLLPNSPNLLGFPDFSIFSAIPANPLGKYGTYYQTYDWKLDNGPERIGQWIEDAAQAAGR